MLGCCLWISWVGILGKEANFARLPDFWLGNGRKNPGKKQVWKKDDKLSEGVRLADPGASGTRPTDVEAGAQVSTYVFLGNGLFVPRNSHLGTMTWKLLGACSCQGYSSFRSFSLLACDFMLFTFPFKWKCRKWSSPSTGNWDFFFLSQLWHLLLFRLLLKVCVTGWHASGSAKWAHGRAWRGVKREVL